MARIFLPPIETCCDECKTVIVHVFKDATLNFKTDCPVHGERGISSPFAKSSKLNYTVRVSENIVAQERMFHKDLSEEAQEQKKKYYEEWRNKHETLGEKRN